MTGNQLTSRQALRARLRQLRHQISPQVRAFLEQNIQTRLLQQISSLKLEPLTLGWYWPHAGEPDTLQAAVALEQQGACLSLPVVMASDKPLEFRRWFVQTDQLPDESNIRLNNLTPNQWDIPEPLSGVQVQPNVLVIPALGFDAQRYRLGYGGGFYDRTLASMLQRPFCIGVAFDEGLMTNFEPQRFDIALDCIITPTCTY